MAIEKKETREAFVYRKLKSAILSRKIAPGQQLLEDMISKTLQTSRTPVRNALQTLHEEGLVDLVANRGAFVVDPSTEEIDDAFFVREELEVIAWSAAINRFDVNHIAILRGIIADEARAVANEDFSQYLEKNQILHLYPAVVLHNIYLEEFLSKIINRTSTFLTLYDVFFDRHPSEIRSLTDHTAIVEAVEKKDIHQLIKIIREHIKSSHDDLQLRNLQYVSLEKAIID